MRFSNPVGFYELNPFPGCNQLVVSNHAFIKTKFRGQGEGKHQHEERIQKATELGYNHMICTVVSCNEVQKHILKTHGWKYYDSFLNEETGRTIEIWGRNLNTKGE